MFERNYLLLLSNTDTTNVALEL